MPPDAHWLVMRFEAPLLSFGGVTIDHIGVTRDFPAASMLTGLLGNALGFKRTEWEKHQSLQDRLVFAVRRDREEDSDILTDIQNAGISKSEKGWTTSGRVEERGGGSYGGPHRRQRDFHMDAELTIVLRLDPEGLNPTLDQVAEALQRPARPLSIGRKPCLPTAQLFERFVHAADAYTALASVEVKNSGAMRALWPLGHGPATDRNVDRVIDLADLRNWRTGLHGGSRPVVEGRITYGGVEDD